MSNRSLPTKSFTLPQDLIDQMTSKAKANDESVSRFVRRAIETQILSDNTTSLKGAVKAWHAKETNERIDFAKELAKQRGDGEPHQMSEDWARDHIIEQIKEWLD